ncbi:N-formylglutamate amidohydrolase [Aureisphaera galaxeae]|uniref:N-formylglutamate amidohydrolase n=1 Tax=Aureisphaera galaxeae TaxID=1538023 RepID=UPI0023507831|nr:N-formylglutamate amidohydrolase [Aureisphaera galaxeae]MDC8004199.1 N-formylglutamate amidohydrolase [Aureisphaera galaxeae]
MQQLSISEIIRKIEAEERFEAVSNDYSFTLKIDDYVPYLCGAVHDGHQFRRELWDNCLHTEYDRWYEEDPCTKEFVKSHPIVIAGCDSRFEYDLNRDPENAIYEDAWGKKLWKEPLPASQKAHSLAKHNAFYEVVHALVKKMEEKFGACVVYDMHSYNWVRWDREVPVINLGTANVDNARFENEIETWRHSLSQLKLPHGIESTSKINDTFQGNGYFLKFITKNFKNTLVLATEFKKIYCDEIGQVIYPEVVAAIEEQLRVKVKEHADAFYAVHNM